MKKYIYLAVGLAIMLLCTAMLVSISINPDIIQWHWDTASAIVLATTLGYYASFLYIKMYFVERKEQINQELADAYNNYTKEKELQRQREEDMLNSQAWEDYIKQVQYDLENNKRNMYIN